ncbi:MAG: aldehyde dehydrogenase family protein [Myxococcales bacterium]|nr:aldehyde dehydrogenase family protein [Myxococcales bacterium]
MHAVFESLGLRSHQPGTWMGEWSEDEGAPTLASANPATDAILGHVRATTPAEYEALMNVAVNAAAAWRQVPAPGRGEAVRLLGEALRRHKQALGTLVALENGKILQEGLGEVQEMIDIADFAVGQSRMLYGKTMHSERPEHRMYEQWHPLGVVGVITAFNFPVAVWAWNACIAAICGNVTVWKPSPKTPLCAVAVQHLCNRALAEGGFPPIFLSFHDAGTSLAERFVADARVNLVSFTGSCAVGRQVNQVVAGRMGRALLELGGNNAVLVDETANLDLVVPAVVFGAVGTAGQRCTTTRRLLVHADVADAVEARLTKAYGQVRVGDPLDEGTLMGPLIDTASVHAFEAAVDRARALGGAVLHGGRRVDRPGHFVQPTLVRAEADWDIVAQETFAPILYVLRWRTLDEAIALQNAVPQGLSSAYFTTDLRRAERFLAATGSDCGIANINIGTSGAEIGGAFGGEKETGGGREAGSDAWKQYMRRQTTTINWGSTLPLAQGIRFDL